MVAPLGRVGLARDHQPGGEVALDDDRGRADTWSRSATEPIRSGVPASAAPRSLSRNGAPASTPVTERPGGLRARPFEQVADHRVQRPRRLDPRDRGVEQLERRRLAGAHQRGVADQVELREVGHAGNDRT